jgi:hypothetical protein
MTEWQPIEAAPRDGSQILLLANGRPYVGGYYDDERLSFGKPVSRDEGWSLFGCMLLDRPEPTHWLPIPSIENVNA